MVNEYQMTWKIYRSWLAASMRKGPRLVLTILFCVMAAGFVFLGILMGMPLRILYFFLTVICIYRAFFRVFWMGKGQYRRLSQINGQQNWTRTVTFEESIISVRDGNYSFQYAYPDIIGIREKGNLVCLDAANKTVIRLYKDAFIDSDWEECKEMLKSRIATGS